MNHGYGTHDTHNTRVTRDTRPVTDLSIRTRTLIPLIIRIPMSAEDNTVL